MGFFDFWKKKPQEQKEVLEASVPLKTRKKEMVVQTPNLGLAKSFANKYGKSLAEAEKEYKINEYFDQNDPEKTIGYKVIPFTNDEEDVVKIFKINKK